MPRKRWVVRLAHRQFTWDDVGPGEQLDFFYGWHPPRTEVAQFWSPWATWHAYLSAWLQVREDGLAVFHADRAASLVGRSRTVARRAAEMAKAEADLTAAGDTRREVHGALLAAAERALAEEEAETLPYAEQLLVAVEAGADPDVWAAERTQAWFEEYWRDLERALGRDPDDRALWGRDSGLKG